MDEEELMFQMSLSKIRGVGFGVWSKLINSFGSAKKVYENVSLLNSVQNKGLQSIRQAILNKDHLSESEKILERHKKEGVKVLSFYDSRYPCKLKEISSAPCFLYVQGDMDLNGLRTLSVVGSRTPSNYGKEMVNKIIREISEYGVCIVSGLAYGIDFLSHEQSIKEDVKTVAILAGGLDKIYPAVHKPLVESILSHGGVIMSELPLGVVPENFHFPIRNRIIAGFSDATLVIEAGIKSGSNITALYANDYNREVFAVPGNVGSLLSVGCNNLIKKNQAHLTTCAEDIVEVMGWSNDRIVDKKVEKKQSIPKTLDPESKRVLLEINKYESLSIDELFDKTDIPLDKLSMILLQLEIMSLVKILPGNRYCNA